MYSITQLHLASEVKISVRQEHIYWWRIYANILHYSTTPCAESKISVRQEYIFWWLIYANVLHYSITHCAAAYTGQTVYMKNSFHYLMRTAKSKFASNHKYRRRNKAGYTTNRCGFRWAWVFLIWQLLCYYEITHSSDIDGVFSVYNTIFFLVTKGYFHPRCVK